MANKIALVVDDHPITHLGCNRLLKQAGFDTILEATDDQSAYRSVQKTPPDLIVLDIGLSGGGGLNMIRPLRNRVSNVPILVFSMNASPAFAARALEAGAQGYLNKHAHPNNFLSAIEKIMEGKICLERTFATEVAANQNDSGGFEQLKPREIQFLSLLVQGKKYQDIANEMCVSYKTVTNISAAIRKKLSASSLTELIKIAMERNVS